MSRIVALLETSRNSLLAGVAGLESTVYNSQPNFFNIFWKFRKIAMKNFVMELFLCKLEV